MVFFFFILSSVCPHPDTHKTPPQDSGQQRVPYVLLYYLPETCNAQMRMLYAGAKELMRNTSEVGSVIDVGSAEELHELPERLKSAGYY